MSILLAPAAAFAQLVADPYATAHYEYDSNIYRVENSAALSREIGDSTLADRDLKVVAGTTLQYQWGLQKFESSFEFRRVEYDHYSDLDHNEYLFNLALDWKLSSLINGIVDVRQERTQANFANNDAIQLTLNTDRTIDAKANFSLTPDWRLDGGFDIHHLIAPLENYPDFLERETTTHAGITYLGVANLTYGFTVSHTNGSYENAPNTGPYSQTTGQFNLTYATSALTQLNGALGYTKREQSGTQGAASAVTGQLGYTHQLTGKTSVNVQAVRAINGYVAAGTSEIDTTAAAGVTWQTTYKIGVNLGYSYTRSEFKGQLIPGSVANGRIDRSPAATFSLVYQVFHQVTLKVFANKSSRDSNIDFFRYDDKIAGVEVQARWR